MRDGARCRPSPRWIADPVQGPGAAVGRGADMGWVGLLENALQDRPRVDAMEGTKSSNDPLCLIPMWQRAQAPLLERHDHIDRRAEQGAEAFIEAGCPLRHPHDLHGCRLAP